MTRHMLDEVLDARDQAVAAGREEVPVATASPGTCEATWSFLGIEAACGDPAIGRFTRACTHEHVRTGRLCREHAETPERGLCRTCWDLPGDLSHECPINIAEVST